MEYKKINNEVLYSKDKIVTLKTADMSFLKKESVGNPRQLIRLCAHLNTEDKVHEMFIVHSKGTYVRPHRHLNKIESFFLLEGQLMPFFLMMKAIWCAVYPWVDLSLEKNFITG